jgi:hypothetical protein
MNLNIDKLNYEDISITLKGKEYVFPVMTVETQLAIEELEKKRKESGSITPVIEQLAIVTGIDQSEFNHLPVTALTEISQWIAAATYTAKKKDLKKS